MILLCGIPSEPPLAMVADALGAHGVELAYLNQRAFAETELDFAIDLDGVRGCLRLGSTSYAVEDISGIYIRLMDDRYLPELRREPEDSARRRACRALHESLWTFLEIAPGRVVNRVAAMASNASKPYQAQLIRACGFAVPETLVTNDPELVQQFRELHGRVVFKSISGERSIVHELDDHFMSRLEHIRWCPVQFQAYIDGSDVRVHVVGDEVFATAVRSDDVDYRYAYQSSGTIPRLEPIRLSEAVADRCIKLSRRLDLVFTGIDLRITPEEEVVCFEVNPCPGFPYYEVNTGQPIARAVADYLACG